MADDNDAFCHWLAGFIDGEGCFLIAEEKRQGTYRCSLQVRLRGDDADVLRSIQERTGLGKVTAAKVKADIHPSAMWAVMRKQELLALIEILDAHPLRAKKARDYIIWREAVVEWNSEQPDWEVMRGASAALKAERAYDRRGDLLFEAIVRGKPEPAGSKRGFVHPHTKRVVVIDANKNAKGWKEIVVAEAQRVWDDPLLDCDVELELIFYLKRPASHWGSGRNAHLLKDGMPAHPRSRPDLLKLARGVEDALSGVLYVDDGQITREFLEKRYDDDQRVEMRLYRRPQQLTQDLPAEQRTRVVPAAPADADETQLPLAV